MWTESSWAFPESYTADVSWIVRSSNGRQRGDKRAHNSTTKVKFLHNYCMFVSLHDSDHDSIVRIFLALSCELRLFSAMDSNAELSAKACSRRLISWMNDFPLSIGCVHVMPCSGSLIACCILLRYLLYIINYITRHNFSPTKSVKIRLHYVAQFFPYQWEFTITMTMRNSEVEAATA